MRFAGSEEAALTRRSRSDDRKRIALFVPVKILDSRRKRTR